MFSDMIYYLKHHNFESYVSLCVFLYLSSLSASSTSPSMSCLELYQYFIFPRDRSSPSLNNIQSVPPAPTQAKCEAIGDFFVADGVLNALEARHAHPSPSPLTPP